MDHHARGSEDRTERNQSSDTPFYLRKTCCQGRKGGLETLIGRNCFLCRNDGSKEVLMAGMGRVFVP